MAASTCYGCDLPILGTTQRCAFCPKQFHVGCCLLALKRDEGIVCNFGCRQAFEAGAAAAQRQRAKHTCGECGKQFAKNCNLHAHVRAVHRRERHGPCPCCEPPVSFSTRQDLKRHLWAQRQKTQRLIEEADGSADANAHDQGLHS